jgi:hypothetical protein
MAPERSKRAWMAVAFLLAGGLIGSALGQGVVAAPVKQTYTPLSVIISEVAWAGTSSARTGDEWIELFNPTGSDIPLTDWKLSMDGKTTVLDLSGTIQAGSFFLLERGDGGTTSVTEDLTYTTSFQMSNTGDVLRLTDPNGNVIDSANSGATSGWWGGSASPNYATMERVGLIADSASAWTTNNGVVIFGTNRDGAAIRGTPKHFYAVWPATPTPTSTNTPTDTFTPSNTFTPTDTFTPSQTGTDTLTPTITDTPTDTLTPTQTFTPTDTFTPTASRTATITASMTATSSAPAHLVISELRSRGQLGTDDEFIELYNPTGGTVNIGGWTIKRSSSCGTTTYTLATIPSGVNLQPGQHYLAAPSDYSFKDIIAPDITYSPALADDGGVALINVYGTLVDQVGMCATTQYLEGGSLQFLPPLLGNSNQSYERKPGGNTACVDTDKNLNDFSLSDTAHPQDLASPIVLCAGVPTFTPTFTPSRTLTRTPTRPPTAIPRTLVLNEFLPHPRSDWNGDQTANVGDEYIEIINVGTSSINIKNWKLDNGGSSRYTLPDMTLLPKQIAVFYRSETLVGLSDGGATVRLLNPSSTVIDAFTYPVVAEADQTWCRLPDGTGTWSFTCRPSPGWPNTPLTSATPVPSSGTPTAVPDDCRLPDTVPPALAAPECAGFGGGIVPDPGEPPRWLQSHRKWEIFVQ